MIEIAGLVVAGATALGTLVQAFYTARAKNRRVSRTSLKKAERRAREPLKIGAKRVAEVIDGELLETLQHEIENRHRKLIEAFRSELDPSALGVYATGVSPLWKRLKTSAPPLRTKG